MEGRINYTIVGLFVVILAAGLMSFVYWLGKYGTNQEYDHYRVYMKESVAGLSTDSYVKYMGVDVGTVERISINPKNFREVDLLLKISRGTPVTVNTRAQLKFYGITGLAFIELTGSSIDAPKLTTTGDEIPVIPGSPSKFAQIDESLRMLAEKSAQALDKFDQLFSEENLYNFSALLSETRFAAGEVRGQLKDFKDLIDRGIMMEERVVQTFDRIDEASASVRSMAESLEKNYARTGRDMSRDVEQSLEVFNQLMYELRILTGNLQDTLTAIGASPGDLLFKRTLPRPGPGEEGYSEK
ncbi:MAG TPA: MCE family protein [Thermodesulfobacteriaceae bacterium]|nr:MCE family protein [Thermodesulfobacteriaceae bacterium]